MSSGIALLLANKIQDVQAAFGQQIIKNPDKLNPIIYHYVICVCQGNIRREMFCLLYLCDIDLCSACMEKYKTEPSLQTCESHSFLMISRTDWQDMPDLGVSKLGESRDRWRKHLIEAYASQL